MRTSTHPRRLFIALLAVLGVVLAGCSLAGPAGPQIEIENVWARPSRVGMSMGQGQSMGQGAMGATSAIYMTIVNKGRESDRLIGVSSDVAKHVELHQSIREGDVMRMQPVEGGIEIPAKGKVELKPGGYHIMLIDLTRELKPGDRFTVTLTFEKSGSRTLEAEVKEP